MKTGAQNVEVIGIIPLRSPHYTWNEPIQSSWSEGIDSDGVSYYDDAISSILSSSGDPFKFTYAENMDNHSYDSFYPTAATKQHVFNSVLSDYPTKQWNTKPVKQWTADDSVNWAWQVVTDQDHCDYENFRAVEFRVEGIVLCSLGEREFLEKDPEFGSVLYRALEKQKGDENKSAFERLFDDKGDYGYHRKLISLSDFILCSQQRSDCCVNQQHPLFVALPRKPDLPPFHNIAFGSGVLSPMLGDPISKTLTELKVAREPVHFTDSESDHSDCFSPVKKEDSSQDQSTLKKKRGRPVGNRSKRKPEKKCGRLWEFIRDLLLKPEYCPSLICWENHDEGVFRFVRSDKVAELWGTIKDNPKMTYEKLSRAMRYYYKSKVLQPVFGRRLVYKFGPTAKGWRTDNPNFRLPVPCE